MWKVVEEKTVGKQLKKAPKEIQKMYELWKSIVEHDGPQGPRRLTGLRDHALKGEWQGARSSYLNKQWRVIYYVNKDNIELIVLEVNPHDYGK
jgi:addiction module RelE/StbE family toxin